ncbi:hypothetical protein [Pseudomonas atacamensis]|uniref:hypothetical protein n=1 Tax=Pseudomonas atacamensis TaxID=2565368 RepID=UPI0028B727A8|nr:hypothetical protein [Pseudomonas atacamensis]MDT6922731.1 hypothetical protein [Pseudomonas atacamensis]
MTDYTELKRLAEAAKTEEARVIQLCASGGGWEALPAQASFRCVASPEAVLALIKDLESHKRMLLAAACDIGAIGEALKADMDEDGDALLGMVIDLKAQNTRMLGWLKDISRTSGDKGAVMGARQLLKEFAE